MSRQRARWVPARGWDPVQGLVRAAGWGVDHVMGWVHAGVAPRTETLRVLNAATGAEVLSATARVLPQGRRVVVSLGACDASGPERFEAVSSLLDRCESLAVRMNALRVEVDVPYEDLALRSLHERCGYRAGMTLMTSDAEIYCRHWRPVGAAVGAVAAPRRLDWRTALRRH